MNEKSAIHHAKEGGLFLKKVSGAAAFPSVHHPENADHSEEDGPFLPRTSDSGDDEGDGHGLFFPQLEYNFDEDGIDLAGICAWLESSSCEDEEEEDQDVVLGPGGGTGRSDPKINCTPEPFNFLSPSVSSDDSTFFSDKTAVAVVVGAKRRAEEQLLPLAGNGDGSCEGSRGEKKLQTRPPAARVKKNKTTAATTTNNRTAATTSNNLMNKNKLNSSLLPDRSTLSPHEPPSASHIPPTRPQVTSSHNDNDNYDDASMGTWIASQTPLLGRLDVDASDLLVDGYLPPQILGEEEDFAAAEEKVEEMSEGVEDGSAREDIKRREIRLKRNRASAALSRQRKRLELVNLRQRCRELERANSHLRYVAQCAQTENIRLKAAAGVGVGGGASQLRTLNPGDRLSAVVSPPPGAVSAEGIPAMLPLPPPNVHHQVSCVPHHPTAVPVPLMYISAMSSPPLPQQQQPPKQPLAKRNGQDKTEKKGSKRDEDFDDIKPNNRNGAVAASAIPSTADISIDAATEPAVLKRTRPAVGEDKNHSSPAAPHAAHTFMPFILESHRMSHLRRDCLRRSGKNRGKRSRITTRTRRRRGAF